MICHCDVCHYTFDSSAFHSKPPVPKRCPDCGKMKCENGQPAVRAATDFEIKEYEEDQRIVMEELYEEMNARCG